MSTALGGEGLPDVNHGPKLLASTLVITIAALISVLARMWVRKIMIKSVGWDDYFICAAMIVSLVSEALTILDVSYGAGRHKVYLKGDTERLSYGLYLNFISQPFFLVAVVLVKVGIGLFLMRLTPSQSYQRFIWGMMGFMAVYTTVALITILTQCRPLSIIWDPKVTKAVCFSPLGLRACAYFNATCGIFADLVFAVLPIPMLWKIKINMRVKAALCVILALGLFATAACIVKVVMLSSYGKYDDFLWDSVNITIWTSCELNIGIFAASIATLKPLFRAAFTGSTYATDYSRDKSIDKNGFVKHISNSRGTSKVGGGTPGKDDGFEMYENEVMGGIGRKGQVENTSEESILPMQHPGSILKTTQVNVSVGEVRLSRKYGDEKR